MAAAAAVTVAVDAKWETANVNILLGGYLSLICPSFRTALRYTYFFLIFCSLMPAKYVASGKLSSCVCILSTEAVLDPFMFVQQIWALLKYLRFARFDYTDLCCISMLVCYVVLMPYIHIQWAKPSKASHLGKYVEFGVCVFSFQYACCFCFRLTCISTRLIILN